MDLFVYGTLMEDDLVHGLTGRRFRKEPAVLTGYRKIVPPGGHPQIVPAADSQVDGFVLRDVDADALEIFDRYEDEGRLYRRTNVTVIVAGAPQPAAVYVPL